MSNKSQRSVFLQAKKNENKEIILIDSNGTEFFVPQLNEVSSSLYKRCVSAANNPTKYCIKARIKGNLTEGSAEPSVRLPLILALIQYLVGLLAADTHLL